VPGVKGGWITLRDAVKKALPKEAPQPGKFKAPGASADAEKAAADEAPAEAPAEAAKEGA
jgi:large subunit ribosomal protein L3